jgi:hypothetical protein
VKSRPLARNASSWLSIEDLAGVPWNAGKAIGSHGQINHDFQHQSALQARADKPSFSNSNGQKSETTLPVKWMIARDEENPVPVVKRLQLGNHVASRLPAQS